MADESDIVRDKNAGRMENGQVPVEEEHQLVEDLENLAVQEQLNEDLPMETGGVGGEETHILGGGSDGETSPVDEINRTVIQNPGMTPSPLRLTPRRPQTRREAEMRPATDHSGRNSFSERVEQIRMSDESERATETVTDVGQNALVSMSLASALLSTLPPMIKFSNKESDCFEEFIESLTLRFVPGYSETQKLALLRNFLRDDAKAIYDIMPTEIKAAGFNSVVREFRRELEAPVKLKRIHWQRELSLFSKKAAGNVAQICKEIESLARKAYPTSAETVIRETQQCSALLRCLEGKEGFHQYLDASLCDSDGTLSSYSQVKMLAVRHDSYIKMIPPSASSRVTPKSERPPLNQPSSNRVLRKDVAMVGRTSDNRNGVRFGSQSQRQKPAGYNGQNESSRAPFRGERRPFVCYTCNKEGHKSVDCPQRRTETLVKRSGTVADKKRNVKTGPNTACENEERPSWLPNSLLEVLFKGTAEDHSYSSNGPRDHECKEMIVAEKFTNDSNSPDGSTQMTEVMTIAVDSRERRVESGSVPDTEDVQIKEYRVRTSGSQERASVQELRQIALPMAGDVFRAEQLRLRGQVAYRETEITVDTGAAISLVSTGFLKIAHGDKEISEKMCKENIQFKAGNPEDYDILDASRNLMNLVGQCILPTKMGGGSMTRVGFHVVRRNEPQVLLGMNALRAVGFRMLLHCPEDEVTVEIDENVRLPPGVSRIIPVRGKKETELLLIGGRVVKEDTLVQTNGEGQAFIKLTNTSESTLSFKKGTRMEATEKFDAVEWDEVLLLKEEREDILCEQMLQLPNGKSSSPGSSTDIHTRTRQILECLRSNGMPEKAILDDLISTNMDVFALKEEELGRTTVVEHEIDTKDAKPIRQRARPVPLALKEKVREMLEKMKAQGIIRNSSSPWSSPCVLVKKKDGSLRMCVDFRKINEVMRQDAQPLPNMNQTLQSLSGMKVFSTFDLVSGFWQVPLQQESKQKTAFAILDGLFQFEVMPYGLCNAPATFQRMMHIVLEDILGEHVQVYIDDILVASESWEQHLLHLNQVFERLRRSGLKLKAQKCTIGKDKVNFLGHVVGEFGVHVDPDKVVKIKNCARPTSLSELRTFLGMASYYRKFVHNFSKIASPLYDLTSSTVKWTWGEGQERSFQALKAALCSAPVLGQPDIEAARDGSKPLIIYVDASKQGIGAVLCQDDGEGRLHPLHFMSERLNSAQQKYHPTDLEALAVKRAVEKFRQYTYGLLVTIRTDHQALVALLKRPNLAERTMRWAMELQDENLKIEYVKGSMNKVADALSRGPVVLSELVDIMKEERLDRIVNEMTETANAKDEWTVSLREDPGFIEFLKHSESGEWDQEVSIESTNGFKVADFVILDGKLFFVHRDGHLRRWVPEKYRKEVWNASHDSKTGGHSSAEVSLRKAAPEYFWPGMRTDFKKWARECVKCLVGNPKTTNVPALHPRVVTAPFHTVAVDLIDMGQTTLNGNRYLLTCIDYFTKFGYGEALPTKEASVVCAALFGYLLRECRVPRIVVSDQGTEFQNETMKTACEELDVQWEYTKGYIKRESGLVERFNRSLEQILRKVVQVETEWDAMIPFALYAYNSAQHSATGESPIFLNSGRDVSLIVKGVGRNRLNTNLVDVQTFRTDLLAGLQVAHEATRDNLQKSAQQMKGYFDKRRPKGADEIREGDRVILLEMNVKHKLENKFSGPYRVVKVQKTSVVLKDLVNNNRTNITVQMECVRKVPKEMGEFDLQRKSGRQARVARAGVRQRNVGSEVPVRRSSRIAARVETLFFRDLFRIPKGHPCHPDAVLQSVLVADVANEKGIEVDPTACVMPVRTLGELISLVPVLAAGSSSGEVLKAFKNITGNADSLPIVMRILLKKGHLSGETYRRLLEAKEVVCEDRPGMARILLKYIQDEGARVHATSNPVVVAAEEREAAFRDKRQRQRQQVIESELRAWQATHVFMVGDRALEQCGRLLFDGTTICKFLTGQTRHQWQDALAMITSRLSHGRRSVDARFILLQVGSDMVHAMGPGVLVEEIRFFQRSLPAVVTILVVPDLKSGVNQAILRSVDKFFLLLKDEGIRNRPPFVNETPYYGSALYNIDNGYRREHSIYESKACVYAKFINGVDNLFRGYEKKIEKPLASQKRYEERTVNRQDNKDKHQKHVVNERVVPILSRVSKNPIRKIGVEQPKKVKSVIVVPSTTKKEQARCFVCGGHGHLSYACASRLH